MTQPAPAAEQQTDHTPEPWTQGYVLPTRDTERWSQEARDEVNRREHRELFAHFTPLDGGRGRVKVATFTRPEDAVRAKACVNACRGVPTDSLQPGVVGELVEALRWLLSDMCDMGMESSQQEWMKESVGKARAVLAKLDPNAKGTT